MYVYDDIDDDDDDDDDDDAYAYTGVPRRVTDDTIRVYILVVCSF